MRAFVFPGQGSQFVGMGKDLYDTYSEAREVFEEVDEILKQNLSKIIFEGPEEDLNMTENTQPALFAVSMAVINVLKNHGKLDLQKKVDFVAGHSLGEYAALATNTSLQGSECVRLLRLRGFNMQRSVPAGEGKMAAILGLPLKDIEDIAAEVVEDREVCDVANDNCDGQVVLSGNTKAVEKAVELASEKGAKRAVILPVSAPFHCKLMLKAAQEMSYALADADIRPPLIPVVCNVTAKEEDDPNAIRRLLVDQIVGRVRWRESMDYLSEKGLTEIYEIGAGKVLCGLMRRINKDVAAKSVLTPAEIDDLLEALNK